MALIFLFDRDKLLYMDFINVILTFAGAYALFLFLAYVLARIFFPTIDIHEEEKGRKIRQRDQRRILSR